MARQYWLLAIGVIAVSFAALLIRLAEAPALVIAAYRLCLASVVLVPIGWRKARQELPGLAKRDILLMLFSGVCLAVHFGLWITSLSYTSVATSVVLVTASPVFLMIASRFLFNQRLPQPAVWGIIISLSGAVIISLGNWQLGKQDFTGAMLSLGGALAISGYLLTGQRLRSRVEMLTYNTVVFSTAAICLLAAVLIAGYPLTGYSGKTYLMMAILGVVPQLIGHSTLNWSLRYVPATLVAVAVLGEPVGAIIWAYCFLRESATLIETAGSILILSGIFLALKNTARTEVKSGAES